MDAYEKKRDFSRTGEPADGRASLEEPFFVVQLHDATRKHHDFRLSVDGVLASWAVPKGPTDEPSQKRLAVKTEDHPLAYADFEGVIPEGEYGAGPVIVWDRGSYTNEKDKDIARCVEDGHVVISLAGERMQGKWSLTRFRVENGKEQWLLVKMKDAHAGTGGLAESDTSIISERTLEEVADEAS